MRLWREVAENGTQEFRREFDGVTLAIRALDVPGAWACVLPNGKRVIGELQTVAETVALIMNGLVSEKGGGS